jgi:hypothetical protein
MCSEMRKKIGVVAATFFVTIMIPYLYLSAVAGKPLALSEFARFSRVILLATVFHSGEKGGQRALQLFQAALNSSTSNGVVDIDGRQYSYPLPQYAVRQPGISDYYLVFVTDEEWERYFKAELPGAGWKFYDQMGSTHIYTMEEAKLTITERKYLTSEISEMNVSVGKAIHP